VSPKHILAATDLEESSLPALRMAVDLAEGLGARLTLVHVIEPIASPPGLEAYALEGMPADWEQRVERGRLGAVGRRLEALLADHGRPGVQTSTHIISGLMPGALVDCAAELGADLLVLGTHGRSGVAHFLLGSVAEKVVRASPCPVLTVRPH
jgi:universal stress protein A